MSPDPLALRIASLQVLVLLAMVAAVAAATRREPWTRRPGLAGRVEMRVEEDGDKRTLRLGLPVTIGRSDDAQLRLCDPHASRLHAIIDQVDGVAFVEDLSSRNGTRVNARPISGRAKLSPGDDIRVGRARITYCGEVPWT